MEVVIFSLRYLKLFQAVLSWAETSLTILLLDYCANELMEVVIFLPRYLVLFQAVLAEMS